MDNVIDDLLESGAAIAQDLQDFVDEGERSGCNMTASKQMIDEWEKAYKAFMDSRSPAVIMEKQLYETYDEYHQANRIPAT